ncbi:MAG: hypothetical protein NT007_00410 [Candidatus Kapabacteria bacterium]|nr:hypothetical protein [Candidatus Kapabacteria bacterium]
MELPKISITCQDRKVVGEFQYLDSGEFRIKLIDPAPERELSIGAPHIMDIARKWRRYIESDKSFTDYGIQRASELLIELYKINNFLNQNKNKIEEINYKLKEPLNICKRLIEDKKNEYTSAKSAFKKQFKSGELSQLDYQKELKYLKTEFDDFEEKRNKEFLMLREKMIKEKLKLNYPENWKSFIFNEGY